ncbi:MAG: DNA/RNA non-specific endonuclease [Bacteroidaceae bacterium]|nr:DNA/RNA non-specific endonuclease [Bacteroidaceae bacterium]
MALLFCAGLFSCVSQGQEQRFLPVVRNGKYEQILKRKAYTLSYNAYYCTANWVFWCLTREHTDGNVQRKGMRFEEDESINGRRATYHDYSQSRYDRGHMCPAGDNRWDEQAMRESFLLSNICPQDRGLNAGDWNDLEQKCRAWARKYGEVMIVCGPVYYKKSEEGGQAQEVQGKSSEGGGERSGARRWLKRKIAVPDAFYKCVVRMDGKRSAGLGFIYENNDVKHSMDHYVRSIDEIEEITGIDFFRGMPNEDEIEKKADLREW